MKTDYKITWLERLQNALDEAIENEDCQKVIKIQNDIDSLKGYQRHFD
jgi:hypothetical protein